jgi:hypothetical protein
MPLGRARQIALAPVAIDITLIAQFARQTLATFKGAIVAAAIASPY